MWKKTSTSKHFESLTSSFHMQEAIARLTSRFKSRWLLKSESNLCCLGSSLWDSNPTGSPSHTGARNPGKPEGDPDLSKGTDSFVRPPAAVVVGGLSVIHQPRLLQGVKQFLFDGVAGVLLAGEALVAPAQDPPNSAETMQEMMGPEDEEQLAAALAPSRLYARQGGREERARPRNDPYAEASLVLGVQPALPTFSEDRRGTRRLVMKRKVLRHRPDGGVEVSDESVTSEPESEAEVWSLRQKMLQRRTGPEDSISEGEMETSSSSLDESPYRWPRGDSPPFLLGDFGSRSSPASQYAAAAGQPKSFIPPRFEPLGRNRGKIDRVAKYFEYKREWEKFPIPGEDQRQELRWGIREQMLCKAELPSRPQHLYVPNAYAVPTEKKRAALRWEVRWDLANGLLPRKHTSS